MTSRNAKYAVLDIMCIIGALLEGALLDGALHCNALHCNALHYDAVLDVGLVAAILR